MKTISSQYGILVQQGTEKWTMSIDEQEILVVGSDCDFNTVGEWVKNITLPLERFDWTNEHFSIAKDLALHQIDLLERIVKGESVNVTSSLQDYAEKKYAIKLTRGMVAGMRYVGSVGQGVFYKMGIDSRIKPWDSKPKRQALDELERLRTTVNNLASLPHATFTKIEQILSNASSYVKIIDPYINDTSLRIINRTVRQVRIQILTQKLRKKGLEENLLDYARKIRKEGLRLEIRYAKKQQIHDRILITDKGTWIMSSSIAGIGRNLESIVEAPEMHRKKIEETFEEMWENSKILPL
jgi:hypothetical protein